MVAETFWTSTAGLFKTVEVLRALVYVSTGVFVADCVSSASFDWSIISGKRQRIWNQVLYFGAKLSYLAFLIQILVAFWLQSEVDCQSYLYAWEFLMGLTVIMSSSLLAFRTIAVHQNRKSSNAVLIVVLVAVAGLVAAWMQGVKDVTAVWSTAAASPWNSGACLWTAVKDTYYVKYVVTIAFDLIVLALTIMGIANMSTNSRVGDIITNQGLIYFLLTLVANLIITILTALKLSPTMSLIAAIPQSTICVIASTRLYSQLAKQAGNAAAKSSNIVHPTSSHHSSSSSTFGTGSLVRPASRLTSLLRPKSSSLKSLLPLRTQSVFVVDLEKGDSHSEEGVKVTMLRKPSVEDVLETKSIEAVQSYQQYTTTTARNGGGDNGYIQNNLFDPNVHPFSNLSILNYETPSSSSTSGPIITQQIVQDSPVKEEDQQQSPPSEEMVTKYPRLFRKLT